MHEESSYLMQNLWIHDNSFTLKSYDHTFKLVLFKGERGYEIIPKILQYKFNFKAFSNIQTDEYQVDLVVSKYLFSTTTIFKHVKRNPLLYLNIHIMSISFYIMIKYLLFLHILHFNPPFQT